MDTQKTTSYDPYQCGEIRYVSLSSCQSCGSEHLQTWREIEGRTLVQCSACGFLFLNPRPDASSLRDFYDPLSSYTYEVKGRSYMECESEFIEAYHAQLEQIEAQVRQGRLLEIGSALGYFLQTAKQRGWEPYGAEISHGGAEFCRQKYGIDVHCGEVQEAGFPSGYFDAVVSIHTLEHVNDPFAFLKECARISRIGGLLVIEVPYIRDEVSPEHLDEGAGLPAHLSFFTEATLREMIERNGFRVLETGKGEHLRITAKKLGPRGAHDELARARTYESMIHLGEKLFAQGLSVEALECFQLLLNLFPDEASIYNNIGSVYWASGDRDMAINCFLKAVSLDGLHWETLLNIVSVMQEIGRTDFAKTCVEAYHNRFPESPKAIELSRLL